MGIVTQSRFIFSHHYQSRPTLFGAPRPKPTLKRPERKQVPRRQLAKMKTILELGTNECRWPIGRRTHSTREWLFCGCLSKEGDSYCAHHMFMNDRSNFPKQAYHEHTVHD